MIKIENVDVWGFKHAVRGMRNPMNSWNKSDSLFDGKNINNEDVIKRGTKLTGLGKSDLDLMKRLYKAGTEHRKYLRQIFCSFDCVAPLYWWKEFDTYKIGTVANSCSTMHKIAAKKFELDDFSHEHIEVGVSSDIWLDCLYKTIQTLNVAREEYLKTYDKNYWWQMIQLLPSSYNQRRTITMNYENVMSMIKQRQNHKLDEWITFVDMLRGLPYVKEITEEAQPYDYEI